MYMLQTPHALKIGRILEPNDTPVDLLYSQLWQDLSSHEFVNQLAAFVIQRALCIDRKPLLQPDNDVVNVRLESIWPVVPQYSVIAPICEWCRAS
jgi:hypothetical protein